MSEIVNIHDAAAILGKHHITVRRMIKQGLIDYMLDGGAYYFLRSELEAVAAKEYPFGMSHTDIAREYGQSRTNVRYHFKRLKVKPNGRFRSRSHANVYDVETVKKFAALLGWDRRHKSQTDESLPPAPALP